MKVLFVNENIGGHATVHHHIRRALAADHSDIEPVFLDADPAGQLRRVVGASVPGLGRLDLDLQPLRAQVALSAHVRRRLGRVIDSVDVVHLYTQNAGLLSTGMLRDVPSVVSLDTTNARNAFRLPYRRPTRFTKRMLAPTLALERRVFDAVSMIVANSEWAATSLREEYGIPECRLEVIPFGITSPMLPTVDPPALPQIVFLGRQFDRKGGPALLEAWRRYVSDRSELVLVTHDPVPTEPGLRVISDLRQGDDRLWSILASGSLLAFPSPIDQAPNAVIEAMAARLPVVAVPTAAVGEMVVDGVTGLFVESNNVEELGEALTELVDDPARRLAMGQAGRQRFEANYDAASSVTRLLEVLVRVRSGRQG